MNLESLFNQNRLKHKMDPYDYSDEKKVRSFAQQYKWIFALIAAITGFGPAFNVASVSTLQVQFQNTMHLNELEYSHISQAQAIPGFFVPVLMGTLSDYYGPLLPVAIGLLLGWSGQFFVTIAVATNTFGLLLVGAMLKHSSFEAMSLGRTK